MRETEIAEPEREGMHPCLHTQGYFRSFDVICRKGKYQYHSNEIQ